MKKLNKKGFTLIELLAVIAILAILMLLVAPNILSMFNSGKQKAFITQYQRVWQAAEEQVIADTIDSTKTPATLYCNSTGCTSSNSSTLDISETDINYCVQIDSNGKVSKLALSNGEYYIAASTYNVEYNNTGTAVAGKVNPGSATAQYDATNGCKVQ